MRRSVPPTRPSEEGSVVAAPSPSDVTPSEASDTLHAACVIIRSIVADRELAASREHPADDMLDRKRSSPSSGTAAFPRVASARTSVPAEAVRPDRRRSRTNPAATTSRGPATSTIHRERHPILPEDRRPGSHSRSRRHLPEVPYLSAESDAPIVALACLPSAIRSQGFAPSQRFHPGASSWLYFKPHPPLGFMGLQSFSRRSQP
jgi:hypothetical protein